MNEPVWIINQAVLAMHDVLLVEFGGAPGLRDESLLESALARPSIFGLTKSLTYFDQPRLIHTE
jgi:hypothetical protein